MVAMDKGFTHGLEELLQAAAYVMGKPGGGDGIVYKVVLGVGREYAVRRLGDRPLNPGLGPRPSNDAEFEAVAAAVARARHPNVVRLRAFCCSAPAHEKLLVYDFIGGGATLAAALVHGQSALTLSLSPSLLPCVLSLHSPLPPIGLFPSPGAIGSHLVLSFFPSGSGV
jgi:hypothetical protein